MNQKKPFFKNNLPPRVSHEQYQLIVKTRKKYARFLAIICLICGVLPLLGLVLAIFASPLGSYTNMIATDIIVFVFVLITGVVFCNHAKYLWYRFPCRFCLKDNPEGATYCMSCGADMLSNETLPEHKKYFEQD